MRRQLFLTLESSIASQTKAYDGAVTLVQLTALIHLMSNTLLIAGYSEAGAVEKAALQKQPPGYGLMSGLDNPKVITRKSFIRA